MIESETTEPQAACAPPKKKNNFAGDVLKLASGATVAQVLSILVAPILSRLYTPEAFGLAAVFTSITTILGVVACMRYQLAIMLPESEEEAVNLLGVSIGSVVLISGLMLPIIWSGRQPLLSQLNAPELGPYLWLVPLTVLVSGIFLALNYWNSRTKHFGRLSTTRITQSMVTVSAQLGAGYAGYANGGSLINTSVLGSTIATLVLGWQTWRDNGALFRHSLSWSAMLHGIKRHRKFPLYSTWEALLNSLSWQLPMFLLSAFFSTTIVGYYALGNRLLRVPMDLVGGAIAQVFFQRAAEAQTDGTLAQVVEGAFRQLVMFSMFPMVILAFIGRDLFTVAFGENWAEAGVYTQILSVWMFFWFISSPMSTLFSVLEKQEFGLVLNIVIFVTRFIALAIGGLAGNARLALLLFALSGILVYGYLSLSIIAAAGVSRSRIGQILLSYFAPSLLAGIALMVLKFLGMHPWVQLSAACLLTGGYGAYIVKNNPQIRHIFDHAHRLEKNEPSD